MSIPSQEPRLPVVIVGPGAMGCLFAGLLWESGVPVWILDKDPQRVVWIQQQGVRLEGIGGSRRLSIPITHQAEEIGAARAVLVWVKSYDTLSVARHLAPLVDHRTHLVSLQNGLGNLEVLAEHAGVSRVLGGTTAQGATLLAPGHVRHAGSGLTQIGWHHSQPPTTDPVKLPDDAAQWLVQALNRASVPTRWVENVRDALWHKLIVNAAINPLTAITRLKNGQLLQQAETRRLLNTVVEESIQVAQAEGICLTGSMSQRVEDVCQATASNMSSMLQDIHNGKRTEIDAINGAIVARAAQWELPTPVNQTLTDIVKTLELPVSGAIRT